MKQVYKVMWYDDSWMEEPRVVETFDDEDQAYNYMARDYESEFKYVEREETK